MSAERPWMKFYPQDWRADERLRNCGLAARGLWVEMLALMHRADRYGYLLINGRAPSDRGLANQVGAPLDEVLAALAELEAEGVFSRDLEGTIFSRRMVRDEEKHRKQSNFGKRGVRAKARKEKEETPPLKGGHEGMLEGSQEGAQEGSLKLRVQSPEDPPVSPKLKGQDKPKHPVPEDWLPLDFGEGTQSRKIVDGWSRTELERQIERFLAHHAKEGSRFSNWQAAWSTWVLNSPGFSAPDRRGFGGSSGASNGGGSADFRDIVLGEAAGRKATQ